MLTEQWEVFRRENGEQWLTITTHRRRSAVPPAAAPDRNPVQEGSRTTPNGIRHPVRHDGRHAMTPHLRIRFLALLSAAHHAVGRSGGGPGGPLRLLVERGDSDNGYSREPVDLLGHSGQRRRPRQGAQLRHRGAVGHRAPVPDVHAVLCVDGPLRSQDLERAGSDHAEAGGLEDRRLDRPRRHDDLDGRTPAPVTLRAPFPRRLHDRLVGRQHAHGGDDAFQDGRHQAPHELQQRPGNADLSASPDTAIC